MYIETTVISYLTSKPSRDLIIAAQQQITTDWWDSVRSEVDCYVSPFGIQEVSRGDKSQIELRRTVIRDMSVLALNEVIRELAAKYVSALGLPERATLDAFHLAVAS